MGSSNSSLLLETLRAEGLLRESYILECIGELVKGLSYASEGEAVSYEDMYARLALEADALPKLSLDLDISPGTESRYSIQLTQGMEQVVDRCDQALRKAILFESRVKDAASRLRKVRGEFGAWYCLAATERLAQAESRLPSLQVKQLSDSEFSRLSVGLDVAMDSLLSAVKALKAEITEHKKAQMAKYNMGKDQVNASWTSHMPVFGGSGDITTEDPGRLLEEEEEEGPPLGSPPEDDGGIKGTFKKYGTPRPSRLVEEQS
jgi:hypothetical protein